MARVLTYRNEDDYPAQPMTVAACDAEIVKLQKALRLVSKHSRQAVRDQIDAVLERRFELMNRP